MFLSTMLISTVFVLRYHSERLAATVVARMRQRISKPTTCSAHAKSGGVRWAVGGVS